MVEAWQLGVRSRLPLGHAAATRGVHLGPACRVLGAQECEKGRVVTRW